MDEMQLSCQYRWSYWTNLIMNFLKRHRPDFSIPFAGVQQRFIFTTELKKQWYQFFGVHDESLYIPFIYFARCSPLSLFAVLKHYDLGIAYLLHVKTEMVLKNEDTVFVPGEEYHINYQVHDLVRISKHRLLLVFSIFVFHDVECIFEVREYFLIRNIASQYLKPLKNMSHQPDVNPSDFLGLSKKRPLLNLQDEQVNCIELVIEKTMGKHYAQLSGDLNPIHLWRLFARIAGARAPFIQGLCTFNYVLSQLLTHHVVISPEKLSITYCAPVYERQRVKLYYHQGYYELLDSQHMLLAFGFY